MNTTSLIYQGPGVNHLSVNGVPNYTSISPKPYTFNFSALSDGLRQASENIQTSNSGQSFIFIDGIGIQSNGQTSINSQAGTPQNDRLIGGDTETIDLINGKAGNDIVFGAGSTDVLIGGSGDDRVAGGSGSDVFVLTVGEGRDIITDFKDGTDRIGLPPGIGNHNLQVEPLGTDTVLRVANDILATLQQVSPDLIGANDFTSSTQIIVP